MSKKDKEALVESLPNSTFNRLSQIDVNDRTEEKNGLTYLSWAWAFAEIFKRYPDTKYSVKDFLNTYVVLQENGGPAITYSAMEPFLFNYNLGYLIVTEVTIEGVTRTMQLPVMDGANKAQKHEAYTYEGWEWVKPQGQTKSVKTRVNKRVEPATMFDINTTIMRCLVKNFAMHGLGHYIYAGEDLPEDISNMIKEEVRNTPADKPAQVNQVPTTPEEAVKTEPKESSTTRKRSTTTTKPAKTEEPKKAESPAEMPDDSAYLNSKPLAQADIDSKAEFDARNLALINNAKDHEEVFDVLRKLPEAKVLATGTMEFSWKFKKLDELFEVMKPADLKIVKERLESLIRAYKV